MKRGFILTFSVFALSVVYLFAGTPVLANNANTAYCVVDSIEDVTVVARCQGVDYRMNFANIRFPLKGQKHYEESRKALKVSLIGKIISAKRMKNFQKYPDKTMYMFYYKGKNINSGLVQLGHAWVDLYQTRSADFLNKESYAASQRAGIWRYAKKDRVHPNVEENKRKDRQALAELTRDMSTVIKERFASMYVADKRKKIAYPANCYEVSTIPERDREVVTSLKKLEKKAYKLLTDNCRRIGE